MSETQKPLSERDMQHTLRGSFNDVDKSISVSGFLVGRVGHKITQTVSTTTVANDTESFSFLDNGTLLYTIKVIYTDGTRSTLLSAERIA